MSVGWCVWWWGWWWCGGVVWQVVRARARAESFSSSNIRFSELEGTKPEIVKIVRPFMSQYRVNKYNGTT